jgi:hypothetical protein
VLELTSAATEPRQALEVTSATEVGGDPTKVMELVTC